MVRKISAFFVLFYTIAFSQAIGPRVTIPQINYDYSQVPEGSEISHLYTIFNGGDSDLYLSNVRTSCKCIKATLDKTRLVPADSSILEVDFTNSGISNSADNYVSIKTNDRYNPDVRIYVTRVTPGNNPTLAHMPKDSTSASLKDPDIYFPEITHDFGEIKQGSISNYVFKFYNKGGSILKINDIRTTCGCTAALVKSKEIEPNKEGELRVEFDSSGKIGKLSRKIMVYSNDPKQVVRVLIIYADVVKETN